MYLSVLYSILCAYVVNGVLRMML